MDLQDYKQENDALKKRMADMEKAINELVVHNMQLSQQMDAYYDARRRIHIYKELLIRHTEFLKHADLVRPPTKGESDCKITQKNDFPNCRMLNSLSFAQTPKTVQKHSTARRSRARQSPKDPIRHIA